MGRIALGSTCSRARRCVCSPTLCSHHKLCLRSTEFLPRRPDHREKIRRCSHPTCDSLSPPPDPRVLQCGGAQRVPCCPPNVQTTAGGEKAAPGEFLLQDCRIFDESPQLAVDSAVTSSYSQYGAAHLMRGAFLGQIPHEKVVPTAHGRQHRRRKYRFPAWFRNNIVPVG